MLISRRILDAAYRLDGLRLAEAPAPPHPVPAPISPPSELPIVPIESLLYDEPPIVPIESLGYDAADVPELDVVPIESLAPSGGLETSFRTYERLRRDRAAQPASLEALVRGALAATSPAASDPDAVTVEIGALCYRGRAALERAVAVRQQLAAELAKNGGLESIQPLLQELLDLVPLALAES
jgi:hypothetical protein